MIVKFFEEDSTVYSRAMQIWLVLIGMAHNRQTTTYGALARTLGVGQVGWQQVQLPELVEDDLGGGKPRIAEGTEVEDGEGFSGAPTPACAIFPLQCGSCSVAWA